MMMQLKILMMSHSINERLKSPSEESGIAEKSISRYMNAVVTTRRKKAGLLLLLAKAI